MDYTGNLIIIRMSLGTLDNSISDYIDRIDVCKFMNEKILWFVSMSNKSIYLQLLLFPLHFANCYILL